MSLRIESPVPLAPVSAAQAPRVALSKPPVVTKPVEPRQDTLTLSPAAQALAASSGPSTKI